MKNTSLYGELATQVHMEQPSDMLHVAQREDRVYLLQRVIYGLKQSPRTCFEKFSKIVMNNGFQRCVVDYSLFIKKQASGYVFLVVYIDDILLTKSDIAGINETEISEEAFCYKGYGKTHVFSGN